MDKKAIKNFAIEARKKLISEIKYKANLLGITAEGIADPIETADGMEVYDIGGGTPYTIYDEAIEQRKDLVKQVKEKGFDNVVEEVAYTWFNRIVAIRFMEVNDYIPTRIRVLSSETKGKIEPDIVTEAPNIDLGFSDEEIDKIYQLKDENKLDELFRILFIKQCNKLNEILPELFEKTVDYTELLLSISFTNEDGVVRQLVDTISEEDFKDQVEIIGWLYQYYNTELKEETFKQLKKGVKISKERIPAATQLFTPDWIVRYMVENSLGRLWMEGHPDSNLKENWKYYLDDAEQEPEVQMKLAKIREESKNITPEDIKVIDPAMGSGHILVYVFEVLMQIYTSVGYSERDAVISILKKNIYGLDIDDRAYQLAYFAVMMKARSYNRQVLTKNLELQLCAIQESNTITDELMDFVVDDNLEVKKDLEHLRDIFKDAKGYGSIINIKEMDFCRLAKFIEKFFNLNYSDLLNTKYLDEIKSKIFPLVKQARILSKSYEIVVTNPPYMGGNGMNKELSDHLKLYYPLSKKDLFAVFIEKGMKLTKENMFNCMVTMQSWMFLSSFEKMRENILKSNIITNLLHMENMVMGIAFGTSATVFRKTKIPKFKGIYNQIKLEDINESKTPISFPVLKNRNNYASIENFSRIPGSPMAYWVNDNVVSIFESSDNVGCLTKPKCGLKTGDTNKYVKRWSEVNFQDIMFRSIDRDDAQNSTKKWFPASNGGPYRKWYGNFEDVVYWYNDGYEIRNLYDKRGKLRSRPQNMQYYFKKGLTWSALTSKQLSVRITPKGHIITGAGYGMFNDNINLNTILGFLNSNVTPLLSKSLSQTLNFEVGVLERIPIVSSNINEVNGIVEENVIIAKDDWNSYETSWDFKIHPLLMFKDSLIETSFDKWDKFTQKRFLKLKFNEEKLNEIFIGIYNLKEEITPKIKDSDVTINKANLNEDIKSFISYAIGCMFGRYSLDNEGLIFAGGEWDPSKYNKFIPDADNIIPILDTEYFEDDIVGRFVEFVKVTFGEETLEENLDFIAKALKKKGATSREIIRNYFLTDFYKDHVKTYKKCPIYWQFDSGKNNGFKALIYMHRYEPDLVARVRTDYLHKTQKALETAITHNERIIENSSSASEKSKAVKAKNKLIKQLEETRKYDEALAHVANQKIGIDLDDGVKVNYAKFQGVEVSREGKKATKIDLLKKI